MEDLENTRKTPEKIGQIVDYVVHNFEAKQESLLKLERYANSVLDKLAIGIADYNICRAYDGARYGGGAWGYNEKTGEIQMVCISETRGILKIDLTQTGATYTNNALIGITGVNDKDFFDPVVKQKLHDKIYYNRVFDNYKGAAATYTTEP